MLYSSNDFSICYIIRNLLLLIPLSEAKTNLIVRN